MIEPIQPITLPPSKDALEEAECLRLALHEWLDREFLPEPVNRDIAIRAASIYRRQRMEGEDDLGSLLMAVLIEMQSFDFSKSFYSEFAIANAVSDLLLQQFLGISPCCPG